MLNSSRARLGITAWALGVAVLLPAIIVWSQHRLTGGSLSAYAFFPLLGLGAFSLMWTHYVLGSLRRYAGISKQVYSLYYRVSSILVLLMILLHPGVLIAQLYRDGYGLPPQSYLQAYPGPAIMFGFGSIALIIFLVFELKKHFSKKTWWKYVEGLQVIAMILVFFHGISMGQELSVPWYRALWFFYGLSFLLSVGYNYWQDKTAIGGNNGKA